MPEARGGPPGPSAPPAPSLSGTRTICCSKEKLFCRNVRADRTNLATVGTNFLQALPRPLQLRQLSLQLKKNGDALRFIRGEGGGGKQCCRFGLFIPHSNFSIPDPGSKRFGILDPGSVSKNISIFNPKNSF
jgi:hypothetical protein